LGQKRSEPHLNVKRNGTYPQWFVLGKVNVEITGKKKSAGKKGIGGETGGSVRGLTLHEITDCMTGGLRGLDNWRKDYPQDTVLRANQLQDS